MKKSRQKFFLILTLIIGLTILLIYWYNQTYSVDSTNNFKNQSSGLNRKLLIAKQTSPFKDSIISSISAHYKNSTVEVEIVDYKVLSKIEVSDYNAILIIFRWEAGAPPEVIQIFMEQNSIANKNIVLLTTSWNGLEKMKHIDAITGASIVADVPIYTEKLIKKLDRLLK